MESVQRIRELRFCEEMMKCLEINIKLMEQFIADYRAVSVDLVKERLPKHYCPNNIGIGTHMEESGAARKRYEEMKARKDTIPDTHPEHLNCPVEIFQIASNCPNRYNR